MLRYRRSAYMYRVRRDLMFTHITAGRAVCGGGVLNGAACCHYFLELFYSDDPFRFPLLTEFVAPTIVRNSWRMSGVPFKLGAQRHIPCNNFDAKFCHPKSC